MSEFSQSDPGNAISKPSIIQVSAASRGIVTYTVVTGDTMDGVAAKFNLEKDTIKWANNLTTDVLTVGSNLQILPRNGIAYVVKDGDTVQSIADKYKANASVIVTFNDIEISGISPGLKIVIPDGVLPSTERPGYVNPVAYITGYSAGFTSTRTWYIRTGTPNNGAYAPGNCTAYAFDRRADLGRPIGRQWGNAGAWARSGINAGFTVDRNPERGAIIQDSGHVAIVEDILPNGDLSLSEMNASVSGGGWGIVSGRILPASNVGQYLYIH